MNFKTSAVLALTVATTFLGGCSSMLNVGESDYACPGTVETGFKCMGVRDLYKATEGPSDSFGKKAMAAKTADAADATLNTKAPVLYDATNVAANRTGSFEPTPWMDKPLPIRSQAKVMRVWVAPYEDDSGDLNAPGLVYTEIEARKWNVGEGLVRAPKHVSTLNGALVNMSGTGSHPFSVSNEAGKEIGTLKNVTPMQGKGQQARGQQPNGVQRNGAMPGMTQGGAGMTQGAVQGTAGGAAPGYVSP